MSGASSWMSSRLVKNWMAFYGTNHHHSALDRQTPDEVFSTGLEQQKAA